MDIYILYKCQYIMNEYRTKEGFSTDWIKSIVGVPSFLASFLVSVYAMILCWNINTHTQLILKILYCIFAFIFSGIYIIYYYIMYYNKKTTDSFF